MKTSAILAGAMALSLGLLHVASPVMAHGGHGGGHGGGHHGGGHHGGGHHGGGYHHGGYYHGGGHHHHHHDDGDFWEGAAMGGLLEYTISNESDPCASTEYRLDYPGRC